MPSRVLFAAVLVLGVGLATPAEAICGAPFLISSTDPNDTSLYSYIFTPGVDPGEGLNGSTISANIEGVFWAVGHGDVALGVGADSGSFPALSWMYTYPGYPAGFLTTWAASTGIDSCIDVMGPLGERCMALVLTDINPETNLAAFAILSSQDDPMSGDFSFAQPGNGVIQLIPLAGMQVLRATYIGGIQVEVTFAGPGSDALAPGAYLSDAPVCQVGFAKSVDPFNGLIVGYRVYDMVLPRGSAPPTDFRREAWHDLGTGPLPLDAPTEVVTTCNGDSDSYHAYSLVFDGGFETPVVSMPSTRIECGPNVADPEPRYRRRLPSRQRTER